MVLILIDEFVLAIACSRVFDAIASMSSTVVIGSSAKFDSDDTIGPFRNVVDGGNCNLDAAPAPRTSSSGHVVGLDAPSRAFTCFLSP